MLFNNSKLKYIASGRSRSVAKHLSGSIPVRKILCVQDVSLRQRHTGFGTQTTSAPSDTL